MDLKGRCRWIVEQDLYWNLRVNFSWSFAFFTGLLDEIVFILLWFERFLPLHKYYKVKTDDVTSGTREVGVRGKCVNNSFNVMGELPRYKSLFYINGIIQQTHMVRKSTPRVNLIKFLQV